MNVVDEIKSRVDIVEMVSGYVNLKKSGRYFKGLCPFHTEKTPSFIVNPERASWWCFGACSTGGDIFSFIIRTEGLDFGDALRLLAKKTGISLSKERHSDKNEISYRINEAAVRFYRDILQAPQGQHGVRYLQERGITEGVAERFGLGLSPNRKDGLKSFLAAQGFTEEQGVEAGLIYRDQDRNTRDFFKQRLMFPIHDRKGRVIGFGGRTLDESTPKYLNTPRTPIFDKKGTLYGLHLAANTIREKKSGVVVEGYMDVIATHQYGYSNVVASMGTALTEQQVAQLKSLASNFVMAMDPDSAGQEATLRSLESSWRVFESLAVFKGRNSVGMLYQREPLTLRIATLLPGQDPDKLVRENTAEWERLTQEAMPFTDFYISAAASRFNLDTPRGKAQAAETLVPVIASMDFFEQERYIRKLAAVLKVSEMALKASIGSLSRHSDATLGRSYTKTSTKSPREVSISPFAGDPWDSLEDYTLALILNKPEFRDHAVAFTPENFHKSEDREVFTHWLNCPTIDVLRNSLDETLYDHLDYLLGKDLIPTDRRDGESALRQCLQRLEKRHLQELQEELLATDETNMPPSREMEETISNVNARLKELFAQRIR